MRKGACKEGEAPGTEGVVVKKLKVAIVGQGRSGFGIHGKTLSQMPERFEIVAVVDPWKERRAMGAQAYGCAAFEDYTAIRDRADLDLVVNATPSHLHVPVTLDLLRAGRHVLTEKPLARRVADVDKLLKTARKAGVVFAIFQQSRYSPSFEQMQKVIRSKVLGRIVQIRICFSGFARRWDQQTLTALDGGNLLNTGPHPLDQALRLMDVPPDTIPAVFCCMDRAHFFGDAEGHVHLTLRAPGAPILDVEISSCKAYPTSSYQVYGTRGGLKATLTDAEWRYYKAAEAPRRKATTVPIHNDDGSPAYCSESLTWHTGRWRVPEEKKDLFHAMGSRFYLMLYKHLAQGRPLEITPEQVRQQIAVIQECHRQNPHIWQGGRA